MDKFAQKALSHFKLFNVIYKNLAKTPTSVTLYMVVGFIFSVQLGLMPELSITESDISIANDRAMYEIRGKFGSEKNENNYQFLFQWNSPEQYNKTAAASSTFEVYSAKNCWEFTIGDLHIIKAINDCKLTHTPTNGIELSRLKYNASFLAQCFSKNDIKCVSGKVKTVMTLLLTSIQHLSVKFDKHFTTARVDLILDGVLHYWRKFDHAADKMLIQKNPHS